MLTATTRNSIFSPTGRSFTLNWFLSTRSVLAATHWSAKRGEEQEAVFGPETTTEKMTTPSHTRAGYSLPILQYSIMYPSMPPAPIFSGGRHLRVQVESVTSSTVRRMGSLVGADKEWETQPIRMGPSLQG